MEKFDRKKVIVLIIIVLFAFGIIELIKYWNDWNSTIETARKIQELHPDLQIDFTKKDTYNVFMDLMMNSHLNMIQLILPILVIIPAIINLYNLLKSGIFKDLTIRSNYKKVIYKEIFKSYIPIIIIPIFLIFMFLLSYLFSGNFNIQYTHDKILGVTMNFPSEYMKYPIQFILIYILNLGLICVFFINVALLFINKNKNFLLTVLFSFLTIMAFQIISEVFLGSLLATFFNNNLFRNLFSIYNLWVYDGTNLFGVTLYVILLMVISAVCVYFNFRNKERVVIDNEK
ncbi:MAG: hypothetical protein RR325_01265 [Bacilli bacterium]